MSHAAKARPFRLVAPVIAAVVVAAVAPAAGARSATADEPGPDRDPQRVAVETVSVARGTPRPTGGVELGLPRMSDDGRRVVFSAQAGGLVAGSTCDGTNCLYVRDRRRDATTVVSSRSDGTPVGSSLPFLSAISGDGQYVAFASDEPGLSPSGKDRMFLYVKDLDTGRLEAVRPPRGGPRDQRARITVYEMSEHGRFIAVSGFFRAEGGKNPSYLYDRATGQWQSIVGAYTSTSVDAMSDNGDYLTYESRPEGYGLFLFIRRTGRDRPVPTGPAHDEAHAWDTTFSGDGRLLMVTWEHYDWDTDTTTIDLVVYRSRDLAVVEVIDVPGFDWIAAASHTGRYLAGSSSGAPFRSRHAQTVRFDRATGQIRLLSAGPSGQPGRFWSYATDISANGKKVLFNTPAGNIAPEGDEPGQVDFEDETNDAFVATFSRFR